MTKRVPTYIKEACEELGKTVKQYIKDTDVNYVIVYESSGKRFPVAWDNGNPVIYGDKEEALYDMNEGDYLLTEREYLKEFCGY